MYFTIILVCSLGLYFLGSLQPAKAISSPSVSQGYAWTLDNVDPDALAARMKTYQDIYPKVRDQALAAYAQAHPDAHPYDDNAKKLIKLMTYLLIWGDLYRESLWPLEGKLAQAVRGAGGDDLIVDLVLNIRAKDTVNDAMVGSLNQHLEIFVKSAYPDFFKEMYYQTVIAKLSRTKSKLDNLDAMSGSLSVLPGLVQKWGKIYEEQIKKPLPNGLLCSIGSNMQSAGGADEVTLTSIHNEIDRAFAANSPDNPIQSVLDGDYWISEAWHARGGGWANTVTDPQWVKFKDYLEKANNVLEAAYAKHPETAEISVQMLTVELGQGQGRQRMEQWFQRAIKADPLNAQAYSSKYWYLQPRWYGSVDDLVGFGQECLNTTEPLPASLSGFGIAIAQASDQEPDVYKRPEVWTPLEKAYREYLKEFPQSVLTRTAFAKHAAQSERWDIFTEQMGLLGDNWDRSAMTQAEYDKYTAAAQAK